jgi:hypothetical protein
MIQKERAKPLGGKVLSQTRQESDADAYVRKYEVQHG